MYVPSKSNLPGVGGSYGHGTALHFGNYSNGDSFAFTRDAEFPDWFQNKTSNQDPYIVDGFKKPKDYVRAIARLIAVSPVGYHEGGYPNDAYKYTWYQYPTGEYLEPPEHPAEAEIRNNLFAACDTLALTRLRGRNTVQLGADMLESRQTLNMIAGNSLAVLRAYRSARQGRWGDVPRYLGIRGKGKPIGSSTAAKWLEYQYGWLPLMGSIHDGMGKLREGFRQRQIYSASAKMSDTRHREYTADRYRKIDYEWLVRTKLWYEVENATVDLIDGVGLLNPLSVAWEVVPFSFVVDWFVPVGNTLSALTATAGLSYVGGFQTLAIQKHLQSMGHMGFHPYVKMIDKGIWESKSFYMSRRALSSFPAPQFYANPHPFSTTRVLNAIALLRQLF